MRALPNFTCPICGAPNACAAAASGSRDTRCWCGGVTIGPELIAGVPEAWRGEACICAQCVERECGVSASAASLP